MPTIPSNAQWQKLPPHPRLFANAARFATLKTQNDAVSQQILALLRREGEQKLVAPKIVYPATGFKFSAVREVQGRVFTLAMLYRVTGEKRYFERARQELLQLAALPDWCPSHFLDVGEASLAAAVGLDWFYDDLTALERDQIAQSIVKNALLPSLEVQEGTGSWVDGDFNWNQVSHGGLVAGALAVAEREPELARKIVERALKNLPKAAAVYAPDGSYPEGPSYWSYGTMFHVLLIEALRSAFGTSCDLEKASGFLQTAEFKLQMVAPSGGDYNFSDYHAENLNEPVMLWFAREQYRRELAEAELENLAQMHAALSAKTPQKTRNASRHLALELLWCADTLPQKNQVLPLHWTAGGALPLAVLRSAWNDSRATFVAIKGGTPHQSHGHMDAGSFILEADGVRWALDLGTENYNKMREAKLNLWSYAQDSTRWTTFRIGPEAHNIVRFNGALQEVNGKAEIRALPTENGIAGNVVELSPLYKSQVEKVSRRVKLHPNRSVSIEDEWTTSEKAVDYAFQWLTTAKITHTPRGLRLEQAKKSLDLQIEATAAFKIKLEDVSTSKNVQDSPNPGLKRIIIKMQSAAHSTTILKVKAVPGDAVGLN